jgi:hypothetical protein
MANVTLVACLLAAVFAYLLPTGILVNYMIQDGKLRASPELRWSGCVIALLPVFNFYILIPYAGEHYEQYKRRKTLGSTPTS